MRDVDHRDIARRGETVSDSAAGTSRQPVSLNLAASSSEIGWSLSQTDTDVDSLAILLERLSLNESTSFNETQVDPRGSA
jgi:hypothetical protein